MSQLKYKKFMQYLVLKGNQGQWRLLNIWSSDECFDICAMNLYSILQDTKKWMFNKFHKL